TKRRRRSSWRPLQGGFALDGDALGDVAASDDRASTAARTALRFAAGVRGGIEHPGATSQRRPPVCSNPRRTSAITASIPGCCKASSCEIPPITAPGRRASAWSRVGLVGFVASYEKALTG